MNKQQSKEQKRKAKKLARLLGHREFVFTNSIVSRGDGIVSLTVALNWNGESYTANGSAKCNRTDVWNEDLGVEIATGRALLRIAFQILRDEAMSDNQGGYPIVQDIINVLTEEFGNVQGVIFTKKAPGPRVMFTGDDKTVPLVPGSAKYRSVIVPEVVPTGLEVMKEKGMLDETKEQSTLSPGTGEG